MASHFSKSRIDRLGECLRSGNPTEADLRLLADYRRSFEPAYEHIMATLRSIRERVGERMRTEGRSIPEEVLRPTGRPAKSTSSIRDKLNRGRMRLSQMQDVAGCRVIVPSIVVQDELTGTLCSLLDVSQVIDRREVASNGYRAVHVIATKEGRAVEVQIRSRVQHAWAEMSEKAADMVGPAVKYGGGPQWIRGPLMELSDLALRFETLQLSQDLTNEAVSGIVSEIKAVLERLQASMAEGLEGEE